MRVGDGEGMTWDALLNRVWGLLTLDSPLYGNYAIICDMTAETRLKGQVDYTSFTFEGTYPMCSGPVVPSFVTFCFRVLVVVIAVSAATTWAMPTKEDLKQVRPLVGELMSSHENDYRAKREKAKDVGDAAVEFAKVANGEAAKYLLLKGAIHYYALAKEYDMVADVLEILRSSVKEISEEEVASLASKALGRAGRDEAQRLRALNRVALMRAKAEADVKSFKTALRKDRKDRASLQGLADAYVRLGDWPSALKVFSRLGIKAAEFEQNPEDVKDFDALKAANYWWEFKATDTAPYRCHAAKLYRRALAADLAEGLMKTIVEKRIAEAEVACQEDVSTDSDYARAPPVNTTSDQQSATDSNQPLVQACKALGLEFPVRRPKGHDDEIYYRLKKHLPGVTCVKLKYADEGLAKIEFQNLKYDYGTQSMTVGFDRSVASMNAAKQLRALVEKKMGFKLPDWRKWPGLHWWSGKWWGGPMSRINTVSPTGLRIELSCMDCSPKVVSITFCICDPAMEAKMKLEERLRAKAEKGVATETKVLAAVNDPNPNAWAWTTKEPYLGWQRPTFNDHSWRHATGRFGKCCDWRVTTAWETETIWLRRHFRYSVPSEKLLNAVMEIGHDDDAVVWLNGVPMFCRVGYGLKTCVIPKEKFLAAVKDGDNVIAVKAVNYAGGQYINLGLSVNVMK